MSLKLLLLFLIIIILFNYLFKENINLINKKFIIVNDEQFFYINIPIKNSSEYNIIKIPIN